MMTSSQDSPRETRIVEMVFPNQTNHYGTLFGGDALRLMYMAAFVTASSERIDFHVPVRQGQLAEVVGRVKSTGRTSLTIEVELWAEDLLTGKRELCTKGSLSWSQWMIRGACRDFLARSQWPILRASTRYLQSLGNKDYRHFPDQRPRSEGPGAISRRGRAVMFR
jgi:thioesterase superfamily protein